MDSETKKRASVKENVSSSDEDEISDDEIETNITSTSSNLKTKLTISNERTSGKRVSVQNSVLPEVC